MIVFLNNGLCVTDRADFDIPAGFNIEAKSCDKGYLVQRDKSPFVKGDIFTTEAKLVTGEKGEEVFLSDAIVNGEAKQVGVRIVADKMKFKVILEDGMEITIPEKVFNSMKKKNTKNAYEHRAAATRVRILRRSRRK